MTFLIILFTLGSGASVWHAVSKYLATARDADRFLAAERQERRIDRLTREWKKRAPTGPQWEAANNWYAEQRDHTPFRDRPSSVGLILDGTWNNAGISLEWAAHNSLQEKRREAQFNGWGGMSGVAAGIFGVFKWSVAPVPGLFPADGPGPATQSAGGGSAVAMRPALS